MNFDPRQNLSSLEQSLRQLRNPYGNRSEMLEHVKSALARAELALANFQSWETPEAQQLQRKLIFTTEMARGAVKELEGQR
jgi:hypothetical protein